MGPRQALMPSWESLAAQVTQGVEFCVESRGPFVLLISGEDLA